MRDNSLEACADYESSRERVERNILNEVREVNEVVSSLHKNSSITRIYESMGSATGRAGGHSPLI